MNAGKIFEQDFQKSVPKDALIIRIPDAAQAFHNTALRFSVKNPCDFILWNPPTSTLYFLELKTVDAKYISFERRESDYGTVHVHQTNSLTKFHSYGNCISGLVIEFRKLEKTIFLPIDEYNKLIEQITKRSFNFDDLEKYGVKYYIIPQKLLKTHYRYDIESFLKETALHDREEVDNNEN